MQETIKKYGVWIAAGAIVLYLLYRNMGGGGAVRSLVGAPPGGGGISSDQYRLETERLRQSGALDLERLRLNAAVEAARRKADLDRFNLEQQEAARRRALDTAQRGQTLGLIGQAIAALTRLFKPEQSQSRGGSGASVGTPPTFPGGDRTQPRSAPYYSIPEPSINVLYDPNYMPAFPEPAPEYTQLRIDDWGEPPSFQSSGMDLDSGASFYDQFYGANPGGDFYYGYGYDQGFSELPGISDYTGGDFYYPEAGADFIYGYGGGYAEPTGYDAYADLGFDFS